MAILAQFNMGQVAPQTKAEGIVINDLTNSRSLPNWSVTAEFHDAGDPHLQAGPLSGAVQFPSVPYDAYAVIYGSYFELTISPVSGGTMSLSLLTALWARGSTTGSRGSSIRANYDDFGSTLWLANSGNTRPLWATFASPNIDLSAISQYQNTADSAVFRFYFWGAAASNVCDFDTIKFEGTVVLPSAGNVPAMMSMRRDRHQPLRVL